MYPGDRLCLPILIEDPKTTFITLSTLREIIYTLEQEHRTVLRTIARETKYGSKYVILYIYKGNYNLNENKEVYIYIYQIFFLFISDKPQLVMIITYY